MRFPACPACRCPALGLTRLTLCRFTRITHPNEGGKAAWSAARVNRRNGSQLDTGRDFGGRRACEVSTSMAPCAHDLVLRDLHSQRELARLSSVPSVVPRAVQLVLPRGGNAL